MKEIFFTLQRSKVSVGGDFVNGLISIDDLSTNDFKKIIVSALDTSFGGTFSSKEVENSQKPYANTELEDNSEFEYIVNARGMDNKEQEIKCIKFSLNLVNNGKALCELEMSNENKIYMNAYLIEAVDNYIYYEIKSNALDKDSLLKVHAFVEEIKYQLDK